MVTDYEAYKRVECGDDQKITTTQDILDAHYEEVEGYQREWQDQEAAKNAWYKRCMEAESILADCCMLMEDDMKAAPDDDHWISDPDEMRLCSQIDNHFKKYMK